MPEVGWGRAGWGTGPWGGNDIEVVPESLATMFAGGALDVIGHGQTALTGRSLAVQTGTVTTAVDMNVVLVGRGLALTIGSLDAAGGATHSLIGLGASAVRGDVEVTAGATAPVEGLDVLVEFGEWLVIQEAFVDVLGLEFTAIAGETGMRGDATAPVTGRAVPVSYGYVWVSISIAATPAGIELRFPSGHLHAPTIWTSSGTGLAESWTVRTPQSTSTWRDVVPPAAA